MDNEPRRNDLEDRLVERALKDATFRERLLADPRAVIEEELGEPLPERVKINVVEESDEDVYLVLPKREASPSGGRELAMSELEAVAGGRSESTSSLTCCVCWLGSLIK